MRIQYIQYIQYIALGLTMFLSNLVIAQTPPAPPKPAQPQAAAEKQAKDENPPPSYQLKEGATLEEAIEFVNQIRDFVPTDRATALAHRAKGRAAMSAAMGKIVELAEAANKTDLPEYLDAKRTALVNKIGSSRGEAAVALSALKEVADFLNARKELSPDDGRFGVMASYYFLQSGDSSDAAQDVLGSIAEALENSKTEDAADNAARVRGLARRAVLIGSNVEIAGTKMGGEPFELKSLRGKVVLVDFWATWCGPCLAEHPNIEANYKKYHDRGFEVVGISLDKDRKRLESHLEKHETPWIILHDEGGKNPASIHYGVVGIPSMFLIDAEGKVVSTTARGPKLGEELEKLLPTKEKSKDSNEESEKQE